MSRKPWKFGCATAIVLFVLSSPIVVPWLRRIAFEHQIELEYRRLVESKATEIYPYCPELLNRIAEDREFAKQITFVHLPGTVGMFDYSAIVRLPNVTEIEITYGHEVERFVPLANQMPSLQRAGFYYCLPPDPWLPELKNPTLKQLQIHVYQKASIDGDKLKECQQNMPSCKITVSED